MKEIKVAQRGRGYFKGGVFDKDICPTIDCHIACWHVLIMEIEKDELINDKENTLTKNEINELGILYAMGGDNVKLEQVGQLDGFESAGRIYSDNGLSQAVKTCSGGGLEPKVETNLRIRKLTPRECGRLQGLKDSDIDLIQAKQSNSSCYHLYGDSIEITVLMALFAQMLGKDYTEYLDFENWWRKGEEQ